ncbi:hypothetical protein ES708_18158 [subsurface metagenome]
MCIASESCCCFIDLNDVALQVADKEGVAGIVEQFLVASRQDLGQIDAVWRIVLSSMKVSTSLFIQHFHSSIPNQAG